MSWLHNSREAEDLDLTAGIQTWVPVTAFIPYAGGLTLGRLFNL